MKAIIHLGTYKTGSSSLQNFCWQNRKSLARHGVLYPETGLRRHPLTGMRHTGLPMAYSQNGGDPMPQALITEIEKADCDVILLSSEAFANPAHLSFLSQFVCRLRDVGVEQFLGIGFFRNLADYQVRHYREFTVNQKNTQAYRRYVHKPAGIFDYLYVLLVWRTIFDDELRLIPFDDVEDARVEFFSAAGLPQLDTAEAATTERANVSRHDAIDVEIFRHLNRKARKELQPSIREALGDRMTAANEPDWTERFIGDVMVPSEAYKKRFRKAVGWTGAQVDQLFDPGRPSGRNIEELADEIAIQIRSSC